MTWFGLATYRARGTCRAGIILRDGHGHELYDLPEPAWAADGLDTLIARWDEAAPHLARMAAELGDARARGAVQPVADGIEQLAAPLQPRRIFATGANYIEHADEMKSALAAKQESKPYMFVKATTSVTGPKDTVYLPPESKKVDWEVELGAVIGRGGRRISPGAALDHVAGYTIVNDVSARDLTRRTDVPFTFDWLQGKSFDTFAPLGPWVVPAQCIDDPQQLRLRLTVNGEVMQDASTAGMIFDIREQIAFLSGFLTLQPGDVIATGTPSGVGMARGVFLKPGDVMVATIDGIGSLLNPVAADPQGNDTEVD